MNKISGLFKKLAGVATALVTTFSVGCHSSEPKCYYGPAPMPESQDDDIKPEVLNDGQNGEKPDYRNYPSHNSNEALDVYGPPPMDLDDPDINPEMLDNSSDDDNKQLEPELKDGQDDPNPKATIDGYPKDDEPPMMQALYGVQIDMKDTDGYLKDK